MREIKFRAWDGLEMVYGLRLTNGDMGYYPHLEDDESVDLADQHVGSVHPVVMQYTGLLDKNGKEIYEGDIVKTEDGEVGTVVWTDSLTYEIVNSEDEIVCGLADYTSDSWEVIGNIYQNPELLT